jgi:hypothetical protein
VTAPAATQDLRASVRSLAEKSLAGLSPVLAQEVSSIVAGLSDTLRLAVAGRTNAGKSTIVNALLHERAAATDRLSCTKFVAWYRFGETNYAEFRLRSGAVREIAGLPQGLLPAGIEEPEVSDLHVWLPSAALGQKTIIDTPGFDDHDADIERRTNELFQARTVDAVLFVLNEIPRADEVAALTSFRSDLADSGGTAINTIAVLTKADQLGDDPWTAAQALADRHAGRLASMASSVVPVLGLLAEAAAAERLSGGDAHYLAMLADLPEDAFWSGDALITAPSDVPPDARTRLLDLVGLYGIRFLVGEVRAGRRGARELTRSMAEHSGLNGLESALEEQIAQRADILQAHTALKTLLALTYRISDGPDRRAMSELREGAYRLMRDRRLHLLAEVAAYEACARGEVELPEELLADLRALATGRTLAERVGLPPDAGREAATSAVLAKGGTWNGFANNATARSVREIAMTVQDGYALLLGALNEGGN